MCATNSFLTTQKAETGKGLGELKMECEGLGLLIRPKVYFIFSNSVQREVGDCGDLRTYLKGNLGSLELGTDILKYAMHSFWGTPHQLLELYMNGETDYTYQHMNKIRESLRQNKQARVIESGVRSVNIDWSQERGFCGLIKSEAIRGRELCNGSCFSCAYVF